MSAPKNDYPVIGFQWELLALITNMWTRQAFGVDVQDTLGRDSLKNVIDDDFCRAVAEKFHQHWLAPKDVDPDRQERIARVLVEIDQMVEELFEENEELRQKFKQKCKQAGCDLDAVMNA